METDKHTLAPGYYWYSLENDPFCIMHVHENGNATLMGTADEVDAHDVAVLIGRGCKLARIEPPAPDGV